MRRTRPAWQAGRVNALGGKLLPGESPAAAASREVFEEAGVRVPASAWRETVVWHDPVYRMHVLAAFHAAAEGARTAEDQEVFLGEVHALPRECIENLHWMVPLALDSEVELPIEVASANPHGSGLSEPVPSVPS